MIMSAELVVLVMVIELLLLLDLNKRQHLQV
jgi:hypothetical protein